MKKSKVKIIKKSLIIFFEFYTYYKFVAKIQMIEKKN